MAGRFPGWRVPGSRAAPPAPASRRLGPACKFPPQAWTRSRIARPNCPPDPAASSPVAAVLALPPIRACRLCSRSAEISARSASTARRSFCSRCRRNSADLRRNAPASRTRARTRHPAAKNARKDAPADQLVTAVRCLAAGDALIDPSITRRLISRFALAARAPAGLPPALRRLTPRELDVLRLVARGMSNIEIARELVVEENTVKTHVSRILTKLNLRDRVQAVVLAYESGLVTPEGSG